jgi:tRNA(fMet)-specific endonuclease VapC
MGISSISLSELIYGAEKSAAVHKNLRVVEEFVSHLEVLPYDAKASQHYGQIKSFLEKKEPSLVRTIYTYRLMPSVRG